MQQGLQQKCAAGPSTKKQVSAGDTVNTVLMRLQMRAAYCCPGTVSSSMVFRKPAGLALSMVGTLTIHVQTLLSEAIRFRFLSRKATGICHDLPTSQLHGFWWQHATRPLRKGVRCNQGCLEREEVDICERKWSVQMIKVQIKVVLTFGMSECSFIVSRDTAQRDQQQDGIHRHNFVYNFSWSG